MLLHLNILGCSIIVAWALWATLSPRVEVGVLSKILLGYTSISAFAVIMGLWYGYRSPHPSEVNLNLSLALLGLRQVFVRYWADWLKHRFCRDCPQRRSTDRKDVI